MIDKWDIILDRKRTALANMELDHELFHNSLRPTIRVFGWESPSITAGYSIDIEKKIDLVSARKNSIDIAKRPTGGGIAFHSTDDVSYSVIAPNKALLKGIRSSYLSISGIIVDALRSLGIDAVIHGFSGKINADRSDVCFQDAFEHEITVNEKKIVGSAQKRTRDKMIQQGTIAVGNVDDLLGAVIPPIDKAQYFKTAAKISDFDPWIDFKTLSEVIIFHFMSNISCQQKASS